MDFATKLENVRYEAAISIISRCAYRIDLTLNSHAQAGWSDFAFASEFRDFAAERPKIQRFKVNIDNPVETGAVPRRTGVYISADDPNAALQFAWKGPNPCALRPAMTFNEIGRHALARVGRNKLWFDMDAMLSFATTVEYRDKFEDGITFDGRLEPELAPAAVALEAFTQQPSRWHFVEIIGEDWEDSRLTFLDESQRGAGPE